VNRTSKFLAVAALTALGTSSAYAQSAPKFYEDSAAIAPFSAAVRVENTVFVSGVIGVDASGHLPADFSAQATNAMHNIEKELHLAGADMSQVFKCDVAMTDMKNWPAFNEIYKTFFKPHAYPVRMADGVVALAKGASLELECEAYAPAK